MQPQSDVPRGFSLVETIFAIALLTGALSRSRNSLQQASTRQPPLSIGRVATIVAQQKMEELRGEADACRCRRMASSIAMRRDSSVCDTSRAVCSGGVFGALVD